ncbi:hypothetical protein GCM10011419_06150 [Vogesella fluminis]|uniref:Uncharacterized protein n=1 Tax=Vogesella fluminis TaxID=1069161 RepID=A0ABQ3H926_9NEIS|nr:hypothetical protein GCM10011419_06150 [Vogesella fluminis]
MAFALDATEGRYGCVASSEVQFLTAAPPEQRFTGQPQRDGENRLFQLFEAFLRKVLLRPVACLEKADIRADAKAVSQAFT